MSDAPNNPTETVVPASTEGTGAATTGNATGEGAAGAAAASASDDEKWKALPAEFAWVKDELAGARSDAGKYRTQLREAQTTLSAAKTPEEVAAALADVNTKNASLELELARERLARTHKLTDAEVKLLEAPTTIDALNTTAAQVAALRDSYKAGAPKITKVPLSGGTSPSTENVTSDPKAAYAEYKRNR